MGIDTARPTGWHPQPRPARHRRRPPARAALARARQLPRLRPGPPPPRLRRAARPARAAGRRAAAGAHHGHRAACSTTPAGSSACTAKVGPERAPATYRAPAGRRRRRRQRPARARRWASASATTARWASPSAATSPARARTTTYLESWLELRTERRRPAARLRLDLRRRRRHAQRRPRHPQHHQAWQRTDYKELLASLDAARMPAEWQFAEEHATGPVRGGALPMGFNRTAALHPRAAARRRRRRRGQPVQRRGHRLRHGDRADRRRGRRAGARPPRGTGPRARAAGLPGDAQGALRRLLPARPGLRHPHRPPARHAARDAARAAAPAAHEVHA